MEAKPQQRNNKSNSSSSSRSSSDDKELCTDENGLDQFTHIHNVNWKIIFLSYPVPASQHSTSSCMLHSHCRLIPHVLSQSKYILFIIWASTASYRISINYTLYSLTNKIAEIVNMVNVYSTPVASVLFLCPLLCCWCCFGSSTLRCFHRIEHSW